MLFEDIGEALHHGKVVRQEVAEAKVILHRPHKTRINGKQYDVASRPLPLRLVVTRLVDKQGYIVAQWTLRCNVWENEVSAQWIAFWYYWRWRIESFLKPRPGVGTLAAGEWRSDCTPDARRRDGMRSSLGTAAR